MAQTRILIPLLFALGANVAHAAPQQEAIQWRPTYDAAKAESIKTGKPIMIYFTTTWCGYCKVMEKETFPDVAVRNQSNLYIPVKVDAEKEGAQLAKRYAVDSYPMFVLTEPDGKLLGTCIGYKAPQEFTTRIDQILVKDSAKERIGRALKANPKDGKANSEMAVMLLGDGETRKAMEHVEVAKKAGYKGQELARALTEYGKMFVRTDYESASKYLEEAIALNAEESLADAYENLILANLYSGREDGALAVARRILKVPGVGPKIMGNASNMVKSKDFNEKLKSPDAVLDQLLVQIQGQKDTRDDYYFKSLFVKGAILTTVFDNKQYGAMRLEVDVDTWIETTGVDKLKVKVKETGRRLEKGERVAHAWLDTETESTLPNGEKKTHKSRCSVTLMLHGNHWMIASLIQESP